MEELSAKFSRLEALLTASLEKQSAGKEVEPTKQQPSSSGEKDEHVWHEGPPHWRRTNVTNDTRQEQPQPDADPHEHSRYDPHYQQYREHDHAPHEYKQPYHET
jgi:hypothetical protein